MARHTPPITPAERLQAQQRRAHAALRLVGTLLCMASGALVLSCITAQPTHAAGADAWAGQDKARHLAAGALVAGSALQLAHGDARVALVAGAAAAIGKELLDTRRPGHVPSYRDAAATLAGALIATQVPGLLITPIPVSVRITW